MPVDLGDLGDHEVADIDEGTAGGSAGDDGDHRREERADDEEEAAEDRGEARAAAVGGAGGGLDERGDRGGAEQAADPGGAGVDDQDLAHVLDVALVVDELALLGDGERRAHGVEEVGHHEGEREDEQGRGGHDLDDAHGARGVSLEGGAEAGEVRDREDAGGSLGDAQGDAADDGDEDAEEQRALDVEGGEDDRGDDRDGTDDEGGLGDLAEGDQGAAVAGDDARVGEADHGDEEAEADGDGVAQRQRDGVHDRLAQAAEDEQQDDDALEEDDAHGGAPVAAAVGGGGDDDHRVDAKAGGKCERTVGEEAHEDGHDARTEAGARDGCGDGYPRIRQNQGVERDDVGHREERREAGAELLGDRRTPLCCLEELVH